MARAFILLLRQGPQDYIAATRFPAFDQLTTMSERRSPNTTPSQLTPFLENFNFLYDTRDRPSDKPVEQATSSSLVQGASLGANQSEQGSATADSYDAGSEGSDNTTHLTKSSTRKKARRPNMDNSNTYGQGNRLGATTPPLVLSSPPRAPDRSRRQTMGGDFVSPTFEQQSRRTARPQDPQTAYQQGGQQMEDVELGDDQRPRSHANGYGHLPPIHFPPYGQQSSQRYHSGFSYGAAPPSRGAGSSTMHQQPHQSGGQYHQAFGQQGGSYGGNYGRRASVFSGAPATPMNTQQQISQQQYQQLPPRPSTPYSDLYEASYQRDQQCGGQPAQQQSRPSTPTGYNFKTDYQQAMQMGNHLGQQAIGASSMDVDTEMTMGAQSSPQLPPSRPPQGPAQTPFPNKRRRIDGDSPEEPRDQVGGMGKKRLQKKRYNTHILGSQLNATDANLWLGSR